MNNENQEIKCRNCGWEWNTSQSDESDKYVCHKCGFDNTTYYDKNIFGKGGLLAPNGKKSNLTPEQYNLVRTPAFKAWFGDWERLENIKLKDSGIDETTLQNLSKDVSKIVDENGEPFVVYHGSNDEFNKFNKGNIFFSPQKIELEHYGGIIRCFFLNVKNLKRLSQEKWTFFKKGKHIEISDDYVSFKNDSIITEFQNYIEQSHTKNEGVLLKTYSTTKNELFIQFVVHEPTQIKLADGTNTTFDSTNPDIRFDNGGVIKTGAFKKWFGNSKVVDKKGNPLIVYHGSPDLRGLKSDYIFKSRHEKYGYKDDERAYFFTDSYSMAKSYADPRRAFDYQGAEEGIIGLYLSLQNPLIIDAGNATWIKYETEIDGTKLVGTRSIVSYAQSKNYDGVIVKNVKDYHDNNEKMKMGGNVYVCFNPTQIKIADGSNTTFDSNNPDIRYENGGYLNEEVQQYVDIISMNPNNPKYSKYKDILKTKFGIDYDVEYLNHDENIIDNANLIDLKGKDDFLNYDNYVKYVYKLFNIRGFNKNQPNHIEGIVDIDLAKKIGLELGFDVELKEYLGVGNYAAFIGNTIRMPKEVDINTFIHEIGHYFDHQYSKEYEGKAKNSIYATSIYMLNKSDEVFAENFMRYFIAPEWLKNNMPLVYFELDDKIPQLYKDTIKKLIKQVNPEMKYKEGGNIDNKKDIYTKWKSLVNMTKSELERFYNSQDGKEAGLTPSQATNAGIDSGRESARWIMKMKDTPVGEWTEKMWRWAKKQISFISRMSGVKGGLYDDKGNKTRKHTSLLIWGHNPKSKGNIGMTNKYAEGGEKLDNFKYSKEFGGIKIYTNIKQEYVGNNYSPFESKGSFKANVSRGDLANIAIESKELDDFNFKWGLDDWNTISKKLKQKNILELELYLVGEYIKNYELKPIENNNSKMSNGGQIVLNEGYGIDINKLYQQWDKIKNQKQHDQWSNKVRDTKFGTYGTIGLIEVLDKWQPKFPNDVMKKWFYEEIKTALNNDNVKFSEGGVIERVLWATKIGEPDWKEEMITNKPEHFESAKKWLIKNGFDRIREAKIDLSEKPNFTKSIKKEDGGSLFKPHKTIEQIAKEKNVSLSYANQQLKKGIKTESEHSNSLEVQKTIALQHLDEMIDYYEKLEKMEQPDNIDKYHDSIKRKYKNGGEVDSIYSFPTPTGAYTMLNYIQQVLVRTTEFKKWFGDWEKAANNFIADNRSNFEKHYKGISKVINTLTLEPLVVYHGTSADKEFFEFDVAKEKSDSNRPYAYFADNVEYSENFSGGGAELMYKVFLKIDNPFFGLGEDFEQIIASDDYWIMALTNKIYSDKEGTVMDKDVFNKYLNATKSQLEKYLLNKFGINDFRFWQMMSRDTDKVLKTFFIVNGYDGVRYSEEFQSVYDKNNPKEFTKAWTIFNANQVKLADGRNINFDAMNNDIRYEDGGNIKKIDMEQQFGSKAASMRSKMGLRETGLSEMMDAGGYLLGEKNGKLIAHNDGSMGGIFVGKRHSEGGIDGINKATGQSIEVEGEELQLNSNAATDSSIKDFNGKKMTNREILSYLNVEGGGKSFKMGGEIEDKLETGAVVKEMGKGNPIVYQGGEVILTRGAVSSQKKYNYNGKEMTTREIASDMNASNGGVSFSDGGDIDCGCKKSFNFGGNVPNSHNDNEAIDYVNDFINRIYG